MALADDINHYLNEAMVCFEVIALRWFPLPFQEDFSLVARHCIEFSMSTNAGKLFLEVINYRLVTMPQCRLSISI